MLDYAGDLGYRSVLFNLVFSENLPARHLWKKLGFVELAAIPKAVRRNDGTWQDAIMMFQSLERKTEMAKPPVYTQQGERA
jgi:L-amino acid N-acyltransferase YncA